jgi:cytidine deaminase
MIRELISAAVAARTHAYNPYSKFAVGAAVHTVQGKIFTGCNIENASFGLSICAERVALFKAYSAGQRDIIALAVAADTDEPVTPCGACLQVLAELAPKAQIIMTNRDGSKVKTGTISELLPLAFKL